MINFTSRWSKIKHDKAVADARTNKARSTLAHDLTLSSRLNGADPRFNPHLASLLTHAKRLNFPAHSIQAAVARGQGVTASGAALEGLTVEAIVPLGQNQVAVIVECQTDSKARTLSEVRMAVKDEGGSASAVGHLFEKKGRIVLSTGGLGSGIEEGEVFDMCVEAGATDVKFHPVDPVGMGERLEAEVFTEPNETSAVAKQLGVMGSQRLSVEKVEVIWDPKEESRVDVADAAEELDGFTDKLRENQNVLDVYTNAI